MPASSQTPACAVELLMTHQLRSLQVSSPSYCHSTHHISQTDVGTASNNNITAALLRFYWPSGISGCLSEHHPWHQQVHYLKVQGQSEARFPCQFYYTESAWVQGRLLTAHLLYRTLKKRQLQRSPVWFFPQDYFGVIFSSPWCQRRALTQC